MFDGLANYMGIQQGWFAKIVKDKFNMKLNIIAPNVAGGGDTLYNTRVAAGELGDLIITDKGEKLDELIEGGLVLDAADYYPAMDEPRRSSTPPSSTSTTGSDGVYGFPTSVSSLKPTEPSEGLNPTFGPYVRWDLYKELGYPEIGTLEDLLPVLADMQELNPTADNGQPVYAFSLFKDWDGNMMVTAKQPACFYGYDEIGFVLAKADGSDYQSILDPDSEYIRNLRLYYEANQLGLVDPESTTQNYDTLFSKFQNGQVLFSWWPWLGQSAYNTEENMADGQGLRDGAARGPDDLLVRRRGVRRQAGVRDRLEGRGPGAHRRVHRLAVLGRGRVREQQPDQALRGPAGSDVGRQRRRRARADRVRQPGRSSRAARPFPRSGAAATTPTASRR